MISILHREMRVASRKRWTFRIRLWTNVIALIIAAPLVLFYSGSNHAGAGVFKTLCIFSFWFCLIQGVRLAANSISDEKREGTLGFLFLTDLRPIDIVMGKLFGIFLPMIQPLMAFLPTLAITILLGGVSGPEFFRAALVLGSVLLWTVSLGLFVSSMSRSTEETGKTTLILLLMLVGIPWMLNSAYPNVGMLSPGSAFSGIFDAGYRMLSSSFWGTILVTNFISASALFGAAYFLPRRWEEDKTPAPTKKSRFRFERKLSKQERSILLRRNPGELIAMMRAMPRIEQWIYSLATAVFGAMAIFSQVTLPLGLGSILLLIRLASQASFPLFEARRSGAIEMILSTSLNPWLLIRGQMAALKRQFQIPFGILCATSLMLVFVSGQIGTFFGMGFFVVLMLGAAAVTSAVGMWLGLREKSPNVAFFKTILYVFLPPVFLVMCFWIVAPIWWLGLFAHAVDQISGRNFRRLLYGDKGAESNFIRM
jgi:hypothetical protein